MTGTSEELETIRRFDDAYALGNHAIMRAIGRRVCDCDCVGTSWTTRDEVMEMLGVLRLDPSHHLLEVGCGAGWPGLLLAQESGCFATLVDLPETGLRMARERATQDGLAGRVRIVRADAVKLPFPAATFDRITHCDLLCCLVGKREVLKECARVLRPDGTMVFSVISVAPELPEAERTLAIASGPPFVESDRTYPELLSETGWNVVAERDLTDAYDASCDRQMQADLENAARLAELMGKRQFEDRRARFRKKRDAIRARATLRTLFVAVPAAA